MIPNQPPIVGEVINLKSKLQRKNARMAELVGIILGDGHIHSKHNLITIVGSLEDLEYYQKRVCWLFQSLFNKTPSLRRRKDRNAYYLVIYSKQIVDFLVNEIGLKRGSKKYASFPKKIISDKKLIPYLLRGLFDTDGCVKFSKQTKNINYYPRIQFSQMESPLANEVGALLKKIGFSYGTWKDSRFNGQIYYQISGKNNANKWFKEISPKNPVHVTKYEFWKKFGYHIPKSKMEFRKNKLIYSPKIL
ncbi:hypothetical protein GOV03_00125 [Candidatus Woesearchaeota archaeon]|nr:hypothetical protein [Candidatus Woesearchaeota archaeon]